MDGQRDSTLPKTAAYRAGLGAGSPRAQPTAVRQALNFGELHLWMPSAPHSRLDTTNAMLAPSHPRQSPMANPPNLAWDRGPAARTAWSGGGTGVACSSPRSAPG